MFSVSSDGGSNKTEHFLSSMARLPVDSILRQNGSYGVTLFESATPIDTGLAANSWWSDVEDGNTIWWGNSDVENNFPVAAMLQYGYSTGTGAYIEGRDYINPVVAAVATKVANDIWKVVQSA